MTRNRLFLLTSLLPILTVQAQTSYEAAALLDTDLNGTARFDDLVRAFAVVCRKSSHLGDCLTLDKGLEYVRLFVPFTGGTARLHTVCVSKLPFSGKVLRHQVFATVRIAKLI